MLLRTLFAIVCSIAIAPCQSGEAGEEVVPQGDRGRRLHEAKDKSVNGEKGTEEEYEKLTPEQRLARNITNGASAFCRFHATVKPAKLMPGQSGVVVVAAILQADAVIPSPPPMEMIAAPQQGFVSLGAMSFQPAAPGKEAKGYLGRPVYDNYAIFEVPVTVSADAEVGKKQLVYIDMRFDLYSGSSTQPVGRFLDRVSAEIEVGRALDPAVVAQRGVTPSPSPDVREVASEQGGGAQPSAQPKPPARVLEGLVIEPTDAPPQVLPTLSDPASEQPVGVEASTWLPLPVLVGGGVLLLGIVLLLARKK